MKVAIRLDYMSSQWILQVLEDIHNHGPSAAITAHPAYRITTLMPDTLAEITRLSRASLLPGQILTTLRLPDSQTPLVVKDIGNIVQQIRAEELNGRTPIQ